MEPPTGSVQSIARALDIIETLSTNSQGMTLSDLASSTGLNISTAHRMLNTLAKRGFAGKDLTSGKYRLTLRLFEIGSRVSGIMDLLSVTRPLLDDLSSFSQEIVHLVKRDGNDVLYIYKTEPPQQLVRMISCVGHRDPMYCTALGKSILACLSTQEVEEIWDHSTHTAFTANTITSLSNLQQQLQVIRAQGYAVNNEEHEPGVRCIAVPIQDWEGKPIAAVSVSAPISRMNQSNIDRILPRLKDLSESVSRLLGQANKS
jgi:DNA-binding IclR family transcriptional regulator